jgi:hypothetical protein
MTIKYITNLNDGNSFKTLSKIDFINRLNNSLPTYEFTGDNDTKIKLYFDIDCYVSSDDFDIVVSNGLEEVCINMVEVELKKYISIKPRISVAVSHGKINENNESKYSVRLFISNIYTTKSNNKLFAINMNKKVSKDLWNYVNKPENGNLFDVSVYDKNKKMRCINTSKDGEDRPLIIKTGIIEDTVITEYFDEDSIELSLIIPSSPISVSEVNSFENNTELSNKVKELIEIVRLTSKQVKDRKLWFSICSFMILNKFKADDWEKFCRSNDLNWDNEKESLFTHLKPYDVEIFYIQKLAKENNYDEYKIWLDKYNVTNDKKMKVGKNDDEIGNILFDELKHILKSYKRRLFYLFKNIWIYDEETIKDIIMQYIFNSNIQSYSALAGFIPVCKSLTNAKKYMETLFIKIKVDNEDPDLYTKFHLSTKGKLCFNDGILDFINKKFMTWEEVNNITDEKYKIYTTVKINKNFKQYFENPNEKVMEDITTKIFNTAYGNKTDLIFHFLSRALSGHYEDKRFASYLGNRNSGKGVEYDLLKFAFEDYVSTFELGNLLYNRQTSGQENVDCSKKLYWLIDLEFVRLAINQEIPESNSGLKVNGKMWKKMTGGGDTIVARRNYDRKDTHFNIDTTFYVKGNNSLVFDNPDCAELGVEFNSVIQFKTSEEIEYLKSENEKKINTMIEDKICNNEIEKEQTLINMEMSRYMIADNTIKDSCKSIDWSYAIIMLLYNNYNKKVIPINKELDIEDNTLISCIKNNFDITNKVDDMILCSEVYATLNIYDKKKIDNDLNAINVFKKQSSSGSTRKKYCFFGLKEKITEEVKIL